MTRKLLTGALMIGCLALAGSAASAAMEGRWKDDGNGGCVFDPNDSGPDQCTPPVPTGRFKDDGNGGCVFDPNDSGPNQCTPPAEAAADVTDPAAGIASTPEP
jgi:hypothetical protein